MDTHSAMLGFFQNIGFPEMIVIGVVALLIFGRRLPEVGRSLGKSFVEFKKGLRDTGDEIEDIRSEVKNSLPNKSDLDGGDAKFNEPKQREAESVH